MAYYLEKNEPFSEGIKRIGMEQNNMAIDALANDDDLHNGIHKARKHFKKLRAYYRLIRDEVGYSVYKDGNVFYRTLGRKLASLRDITSRIEAVGFLRVQYGERISAEAFEVLLALLDEERETIRATEEEGENQVEETIELLHRERGRFIELPVRDQCLKNTIASIHRVYERGYKGYKRSLGDPSVEEMHDWRKRVKYLWYHYRMLRQAWPRVFRAYKKEAKILADFLGDYHDLALLMEKMEDYQERLPEEARRILSASASHYMLKLLEESRKLGALVYNEPPKVFAKKMRRVLKENLL
ncbi:MAG: CHAD domain-containing protein [Lewinellaceae bacterium]|nr:CHAD domain-containing protein [Lewinellaceae bacterium]